MTIIYLIIWAALTLFAYELWIRFRSSMLLNKYDYPKEQCNRLAQEELSLGKFFGIMAIMSLIVSLIADKYL